MTTERIQDYYVLDISDWDKSGKDEDLKKNKEKLKKIEEKEKESLSKENKVIFVYPADMLSAQSTSEKRKKTTETILNMSKMFEENDIDTSCIPISVHSDNNRLPTMVELEFFISKLYMHVGLGDKLVFLSEKGGDPLNNPRARFFYGITQGKFNKAMEGFFLQQELKKLCRFIQARKLDSTLQPAEGIDKTIYQDAFKSGLENKREKLDDTASIPSAPPAPIRAQTTVQKNTRIVEEDNVNIDEEEVLSKISTTAQSRRVENKANPRVDYRLSTMLADLPDLHQRGKSVRFSRVPEGYLETVLEPTSDIKSEKEKNDKKRHELHRRSVSIAKELETQISLDERKEVIIDSELAELEETRKLLAEVRAEKFEEDRLSLSLTDSVSSVDFISSDKIPQPLTEDEKKAFGLIASMLIEYIAKANEDIINKIFGELRRVSENENFTDLREYAIRLSDGETVTKEDIELELRFKGIEIIKLEDKPRSSIEIKKEQELKLMGESASTASHEDDDKKADKVKVLKEKLIDLRKDQEFLDKKEIEASKEDIGVYLSFMLDQIMAVSDFVNLNNDVEIQKGIKNIFSAFYLLQTKYPKKYNFFNDKNEVMEQEDKETLEVALLSCALRLNKNSRPENIEIDAIFDAFVDNNIVILEFSDEQIESIVEKLPDFTLNQAPVISKSLIRKSSEIGIKKEERKQVKTKPLSVPMTSQERLEEIVKGSYWYEDNDCDDCTRAAVSGELGGYEEGCSYRLKDTFVGDAGIEDTKDITDTRKYQVFITPPVNGQSSVPKHTLGITYFLDEIHQPNETLKIYEEIIKLPADKEGKITLSEDAREIARIIEKYEFDYDALISIVSTIASLDCKIDKIKKHMESLKKREKVSLFSEMKNTIKDIYSIDEKTNEKTYEQQFFKILSLCNIGHYPDETKATSGGSHWITLEILIIRGKDTKNINDIYTVHIYGHDPKGGDKLSSENKTKIFEAVKKKLKEISGEKTVINRADSFSNYSKRQSANTECGVIACDDLIKRAKGETLNLAEPYPEGAVALRQKQAKSIDPEFVLPGDKLFTVDPAKLKGTPFTINKPTYRQTHSPAAVTPMVDTSIARNRSDSAGHRGDMPKRPESAPPQTHNTVPDTTSESITKEEYLAFIYYQLSEILSKSTDLGNEINLALDKSYFIFSVLDNLSISRKYGYNFFDDHNISKPIFKADGGSSIEEKLFNNLISIKKNILKSGTVSSQLLEDLRKFLEDNKTKLVKAELSEAKIKTINEFVVEYYNITEFEKTYKDNSFPKMQNTKNILENLKKLTELPLKQRKIFIEFIFRCFEDLQEQKNNSNNYELYIVDDIEKIELEKIDAKAIILVRLINGQQKTYFVEDHRFVNKKGEHFAIVGNFLSDSQQLNTDSNGKVQSSEKNTSYTGNRKSIQSTDADYIRTLKNTILVQSGLIYEFYSKNDAKTPVRQGGELSFIQGLFNCALDFEREIKAGKPFSVDSLAHLEWFLMQIRDENLPLQDIYSELGIVVSSNKKITLEDKIDALSNAIDMFAEYDSEKKYFNQKKEPIKQVSNSSVDLSLEQKIFNVVMELSKQANKILEKSDDKENTLDGSSTKITQFKKDDIDVLEKLLDEAPLLPLLRVKVDDQLTKEERLEMHNKLVKYICSMLHSIYSPQTSENRKQALMNVWKAFYLLQQQGEFRNRRYKFFDIKDAYKAVYQKGENLTPVQELFNAVLDIMRKENAAEADMINLRGILLKSPKIFKKDEIDEIREIQQKIDNCLLPRNPLEDEEFDRKNEIKLHVPEKGPFTAMFAAMVEHIVMGNFDDIPQATEATRNDIARGQRRWEKLFKDHNIEDRLDWTFENIKAYFISHNTYQSQRELCEKFAPIFRNEMGQFNRVHRSRYIKNTEDDIEEVFKAYIQSKISGEKQSIESAFLHCPEIMTYFDNLYTFNIDSTIQNAMASISSYLNYTEQNNTELVNSLNKMILERDKLGLYKFLYSPDKDRHKELIKTLKKEWKENLAEKFIDYTAQENSAAGFSEITPLLVDFGFDVDRQIKQEDITQTLTRSTITPVEYGIVNYSQIPVYADNNQIQISSVLLKILKEEKVIKYVSEREFKLLIPVENIKKVLSNIIERLILKDGNIDIQKLNHYEINLLKDANVLIENEDKSLVVDQLNFNFEAVKDFLYTILGADVFEELYQHHELRKPPIVLEAKNSLEWQHVPFEDKSSNIKAEWLKPAPEHYRYKPKENKKTRKMIKEGAGWPSVYDVGIQIKNNSDRNQVSYWRLTEPQNTPEEMMSASRFIPALQEKLKRHDAKITKKLEKALIDLFNKLSHKNSKIILQEGDVNEQLRSAYLAYLTCKKNNEEFILIGNRKLRPKDVKRMLKEGKNKRMLKEEEKAAYEQLKSAYLRWKKNNKKFSLAEFNRHEVLSWYLTHASEGLLPLTNRLVGAGFLASDQQYLIWKKYPDCIIKPCHSSLSKHSTKPSVHIIQTKDEKGNVIFKQLRAEEKIHLRYVTTYEISGSLILSYDEGESLYLDKTIFYNWEKIRADLELLLHFQTEYSNGYWLSSFDKYNTEIGTQVAYLEETFHITIRSLEILARNPEIAAHMLNEYEKNIGQKLPSEYFEKYVEKIKLLLKAFNLVKNEGYIGSQENSAIKEAQNLINQTYRGRKTYVDPYAKKDRRSKWWNFDRMGESAVYPHLAYRCLIVNGDPSAGDPSLNPNTNYVVKHIDANARIVTKCEDNPLFQSPWGLRALYTVGGMLLLNTGVAYLTAETLGLDIAFSKGLKFDKPSDQFPYEPVPDPNATKSIREIQAQTGGGIGGGTFVVIGGFLYAVVVRPYFYQKDFVYFDEFSRDIWDSVRGKIEEKENTILDSVALPEIELDGKKRNSILDIEESVESDESDESDLSSLEESDSEEEKPSSRPREFPTYVAPRVIKPMPERKLDHSDLLILGKQHDFQRIGKQKLPEGTLTPEYPHLLMPEEKNPREMILVFKREEMEAVLEKEGERMEAEKIEKEALKEKTLVELRRRRKPPLPTGSTVEEYKPATDRELTSSSMEERNVRSVRLPPLKVNKEESTSKKTYIPRSGVIRDREIPSSYTQEEVMKQKHDQGFLNAPPRLFSNNLSPLTGLTNFFAHSHKPVPKQKQPDDFLTSEQKMDKLKRIHKVLLEVISKTNSRDENLLGVRKIAEEFSSDIQRLMQNPGLISAHDLHKMELLMLEHIATIDSNNIVKLKIDLSVPQNNTSIGNNIASAARALTDAFEKMKGWLHFDLISPEIAATLKTKIVVDRDGKEKTTAKIAALQRLAEISSILERCNPVVQRTILDNHQDKINALRDYVNNNPSLEEKKLNKLLSDLESLNKFIKIIEDGIQAKASQGKNKNTATTTSIPTSTDPVTTKKSINTRPKDLTGVVVDRGDKFEGGDDETLLSNMKYNKQGYTRLPSDIGIAESIGQRGGNPAVGKRQNTPVSVPNPVKQNETTENTPLVKVKVRNNM